MHSGVFATTPEVAGEVLVRLVRGGLVRSTLGDVRDLDEVALRAGSLQPNFYGELLVPELGGFLGFNSPRAPQSGQRSEGPGGSSPGWSGVVTTFSRKAFSHFGHHHNPRSGSVMSFVLSGTAPPLRRSRPRRGELAGGSRGRSLDSPEAALAGFLHEPFQIVRVDVDRSADSDRFQVSPAGCRRTLSRI